MSLRNPVKYPVKYYSWQDDQAPRLTDADGVIKTILKACLVTGYGTKQGAGWTALFEDAYRIVLRRPLRTGNPPDIKIENGTITGTTVRHRVVAQDNPTGLDDATELSAVNLLARDSTGGKEWHLIVTDFAFVLCYAFGEQNYAGGNQVLYVGSIQKLQEADSDYFVVTTQNNVTINGAGTGSGWQMGFLSNDADTSGTPKLMSIWLDARRKVYFSDKKKYLLIDGAETKINNDFFAQKVMIGAVAILPFFTPIFTQTTSKSTSIVNINARNMLRFVNTTYRYNTYATNTYQSILYIPLDYWEL